MILLIDNYDSFSHNLARYFLELGCELKVVRNDAITLDEIDPAVFDGIVISPGPCTPDESGISLDVIRHFAGVIPVMGVCLGHQAIGQVFGATITRAKQIRHGKVSAIKHNDDALFKDVPTHFNVTRYHSLVIAPQTLPDCLEVLAWSDSDASPEIMAIRHKTLPLWGVQYHPESLLTEYGHQVLLNFLTLAKVKRKQADMTCVSEFNGQVVSLS
ncbi:anthranilate synthase component II [Alteromonas lipolytica]|uniref:Aminodeoxychorismate/anthranilate synthase component II n=1 Tax=Alteromonas lipolytica TaxID=1856405 RepID=A0A1E8FC88_9ALTE|nr:aminodeoxychorismate/anthranilate synthase component II [Alteromonas lipolytica]OFI33228.1 aminodeoxychorismate/anthranilate synthase component II [Alteromonas lipolytica]GGF61482.1 glutamine amidotransferase [Alteromonas lipolytica]